MKKKNIIISIACSIFFIICVGATIILFPKVKEETIAYSTSIEDLFEKEGHFYVYFNRKECPYCDNIEDDIKQFKKENAVYEIDAEACKGTRNYDWDSGISAKAGKVCCRGGVCPGTLVTAGFSGFSFNSN